MKIFKLSQNQMVPTVPGGTSAENANIQINNLNQALPILNKMRDVIQMANDLHAKAAELGKMLGEMGLADQVLKSVQEVISQNAEFASLIQIGVVGSIEELFNSGSLEQKITFTTRQLQEAQSAAAQNSNPQQN